MLRKPSLPPGAGVGFNTTMNKKSPNKKPLQPTKPSPKKTASKRRTRRRARGGNPRIMYE